VAAATVAAAYSTTLVPAHAANFIHLTTFGIWLGTNVWNSFFVGAWRCSVCASDHQCSWRVAHDSHPTHTSSAATQA
jgi:hypothetical protein